MTTKAKCEALAKEHGITLDISKNGREWGCMISIPRGYTLEEFEGARTGLSLFDVETAKEFWKEVHEDLKACINYKPWHKINQTAGE